MSNIWTLFQSLLPKTVTAIGTVAQVINGVYYVNLLTGDQVQARSSAAYGVGTRVFISNGVIQGTAPTLDYITIDV